MLSAVFLPMLLSGQIPDMLGVVLSSSKYGVRQARGKYGMGAKMALIWSKKSTGLPIQVPSTAAVLDIPGMRYQCVEVLLFSQPCFWSHIYCNPV